MAFSDSSRTCIEAVLNSYNQGSKWSCTPDMWERMIASVTACMSAQYDSGEADANEAAAVEIETNLLSPAADVDATTVGDAKTDGAALIRALIA
jgi:hypothetical protein